MLETKEFQPHVLDVQGDVQYTCPICDYRSQSNWGFPKRCKECGAIFEWTVKVHYQEKEDAEE